MGFHHWNCLSLDTNLFQNQIVESKLRWGPLYAELEIRRALRNLNSEIPRLETKRRSLAGVRPRKFCWHAGFGAKRTHSLHQLPRLEQASSKPGGAPMVQPKTKANIVEVGVRVPHSRIRPGQTNSNLKARRNSARVQLKDNVCKPSFATRNLVRSSIAGLRAVGIARST